MAYTKYSLTPADNNSAPPNGAPEGMLPSAVNDTMRDMMSQIRDAGDGIRNGTYTMTAPVITGGSITGVALSGNTLTNPVITGGSINNTPVGASTANTGAFTTLSASSTATLSALTASTALALNASKNVVSVANTGTGNNVLATSPTLVTPVLGTPSSGTLTSCTGLPISTGVSGLGTNVATFLATPSSANLALAITNETGSGSLVFGTSPTVSGIVINDGYTEEVFAVTGTTPALSPANGSIQTWTLSGNSTPTAGTWNAGQSITLMIDDGSAFTVTWSSLAVTWKTNAGVAPTLNTTGFTVITLWKVNTTIYGARVGDA